MAPTQRDAWLEEEHSLTKNYNRNYHEELLLNSGGSVQKTIHSIDPNAIDDQIKDIILHNHSNLKTPSQRSHAYQSIQQKPDEALQNYNIRYESLFHLANPHLRVNDETSMVNCIHYANSLYGKLGDEMKGRFNKDLLESLQSAFEKATNFESWILTNQ